MAYYENGADTSDAELIVAAVQQAIDKTKLNLTLTPMFLKKQCLMTMSMGKGHTAEYTIVWAISDPLTIDIEEEGVSIADPGYENKLVDLIIDVVNKLVAWCECLKCRNDVWPRLSWPDRYL